MSFYTRLQATATRLMERFKQGSISYTSPPTTSGSSFNPTIVAGTNYALKATAKGVSKQYIDGSFIVSSDIEVTCAVFGFAPVTAGTITIDGNVHQIVQVIAIPSAGTTLAWRLICRR